MLGRRRSAAVSLLLASCLAACSSSPAARPSPTPVPLSTQAVAASLSQADELFFSNHYDRAGRDYAMLVAQASHDALALSSYALYLNYRMDFGDALTEAKAGVAAAPRSGEAAAVLTRVEDWSMDVVDAVATGGRAVSLAPSNPITHLFLAEALADHGDTAASQKQIDAAAALVGPGASAFDRAEVQRETANLDRDTGDTAGEVAADAAAKDAQPGWVERYEELAEAYIDADQLAGAHTTLQAALALAPNDPVLLASLGSVALQQPDYATAGEAYTRLLTVDPRDPSVLESAALVDEAAHRDSHGARQLLLQALSIDPQDVNAVDFILRLARDVDGDVATAQAQILDTVAAAEGADSDHPTPVTVPDPNAVRAGHDAIALAGVNATRAAAGLAPVTLNAGLTASAANHCFYWLANNALPAESGLGIHEETPATPGFTGIRAGDRDIHAGWRGTGTVAEDITHRGGPDPAVTDWVDSVYHRFPIIRPDLQQIGYADCALGPLPMEDMEFSFGAAPPGAGPVVVPGAGQTQVLTTFQDNELPDPLPPGASRNAGFPITVTFSEYAGVVLQSFTLRDASGAEVPSYTLSPNYSDENSAALLPRSPLKSASTYTAQIVATVNGRGYTRTWSFTTA